MQWCGDSWWGHALFGSFVLVLQMPHIYATIDWGLIFFSNLLQPKPVHHTKGSICQICGDDVGVSAEGELFVACNECAFPVCRPCFEYERKDGNQACPQCKTRYKRLRGETSFWWWILRESLAWKNTLPNVQTIYKIQCSNVGNYPCISVGHLVLFFWDRSWFWFCLTVDELQGVLVSLVTRKRRIQTTWKRNSTLRWTSKASTTLPRKCFTVTWPTMALMITTCRIIWCTSNLSTPCLQMANR